MTVLTASPATPSAPGPVHLPAGFLPAGHRIVLMCACGWTSPATVDRQSAWTAAARGHVWTPLACARCGQPGSGGVSVEVDAAGYAVLGQLGISSFDPQIGVRELDHRLEDIDVEDLEQEPDREILMCVACRDEPAAVVVPPISQ